MSRARVSAIELLGDLHTALSRLGHEAHEALVEAAIGIRRAQEALDDKLKFWMREVERRHEDVNRAKADLSFKKTASVDGKSGMTEAEITLKKAQQRLRDAEEKVATCRKWISALPHALKDFDAPARQLQGFLDADLRRGLELLKKHSATLAAYTTMQAPSVGALPSAAPATEPPPAPANAQPSPPPGDNA